MKLVGEGIGETEDGVRAKVQIRIAANASAKCGVVRAGPCTFRAVLPLARAAPAPIGAGWRGAPLRSLVPRIRHRGL